MIEFTSNGDHKQPLVKTKEISSCAQSVVYDNHLPDRAGMTKSRPRTGETCENLLSDNGHMLKCYKFIECPCSLRG